MSGGMRHSPCRENCAQVPRGPTVPILGDGPTCPQRETCIKARTAALPLTALKWKGEHKRTIPKRMDHKLRSIQTMKCSQATEKNNCLHPQQRGWTSSTPRRVRGATLRAHCAVPPLWGSRRGQTSSCEKSVDASVCETCARVQACMCVFPGSILGWVLTVYTGQRYRTVKTYRTQHLIWIICKLQVNQKEQTLKPKTIKRKMFKLFKIEKWTK